jgi:hypothetical protein
LQKNSRGGLLTRPKSSSDNQQNGRADAPPLHPKPKKRIKKPPSKGSSNEPGGTQEEQRKTLRQSPGTVSGDANKKLPL